MPADPDKHLHANRAQSVPTCEGVRNCFSRGDILEGRTPAAWGSEQSAGITTGGQKEDDPTTWTKRWYAKGRVLRMPKAVVLSSHPQWTLYWPRTHFYMPRDVIGDDGYGQFGNYYYLDQWNGLDAATASLPDYSFVSSPDASNNTPGYASNSAWDAFKFLDPGDKDSTYNARASCFLQQGSGCESIPSWLMNTCQDPPKSERFQQEVGVLENPYYLIHPRLMAAFREAKKILEEDTKDPIYVSIPNWMPEQLRQVRNGFLKRSHESRFAGHGGAINGRSCKVTDVLPCYNHAPMCWAPPYPDDQSPYFNMGFRGPQVPWLANVDPGVGTNSLHIYIGHPNMSYTATNSVFDYQAWPLTPEVQWIAGPVFLGTYTGSTLPFFAGRRAIWRAFGFDYGYVNHGADGLYESRYKGIVEGAADDYKKNFWKMRNYGTRLFTYKADWNFNWNFNSLSGDRRNDCPSTRFYFGDKDFAEFAADFNTEDEHIDDCMGKGDDPTVLIKVGEVTVYFPTRAAIDRAIAVGQNLTKRVQDYYLGNDKGSGEFFQIAIDKAGLADYNVSYEGAMPGAFNTAGGIVDYVREYFKDNR